MFFCESLYFTRSFDSDRPTQEEIAEAAKVLVIFADSEFLQFLQSVTRARNPSTDKRVTQ